MSNQDNESTAGAKAACERCKGLEARIRDLELERSDLLLALARERERANALFLAYPASPQAPSAAPAAPVVGKPPLRHRLVDAVNNSLKRQFPDVHRAAKDVGASLLHKLK
ncbi:MAG TPA: hypothetical protein VF815_10105 [Myxococcaceae bacterium]